jgi:predicted Fe-S protein YdhL (DUF1289 family)
MKPAAAATAALADAVPSPCINVCRMNPIIGYCEGCHRTLSEIAGWSAYSDRQKRAVLALLPARKTRR